MSLEDYRRRRNFDATPEPAGGEVPPGPPADPIFVVQKHRASHLHYDFRLELEGVLKSWAIPKGPSLDPAEKRLAVAVEDHPLGYAAFQGTIPEGEYGAGRVVVWDRGTYRPAEEGETLAAMLARGAVKIILDGQRLRGGFHLVRTRWGGRKENWLLIKERDRWARPGSEVTEEMRGSVITGDDV
jgi:DNA ligase D-like protein (predicted 3'-phosphoesterase)